MAKAQSTRIAHGSDRGEGLLGRTVLGLNEALSSLQAWSVEAKKGAQKGARMMASGAVCQPQVERTSSWGTTKAQKGQSNVMGAITSCTGTPEGGSPLRSMKRFVDNAVDQMDQAVDEAVRRMEAPRRQSNEALTNAPSMPRVSTPHPNASNMIYNLDSNDDDDDYDEELQMRRLGSWETDGTFGTIGTYQSTTTIKSDDKQQTQPLDDDGNPINPRLLEKLENAQKRSGKTKRKRLVKFDYPPVSSLRQCPRPDEEDLPNMFFSEGELDQLEDDRISTFVADDVEIVAVASSMSEDPKPAKSKAQLGNNYVPAPRRGSAAGAKPKKSSKRSGDDKRLIKSVQIYLRERSTVCSSKRT